MRHTAFAPRRVLWMACACLLLLPYVVAAAEPALAIDFDGDGRHDRVLIDTQQPSVLRVWLSGSDTLQVLYSHVPLQNVAATDLDGDHRPELIARDSQAHIQVWTPHRRGFRKYRPRHSVPHELTTPTQRRVEDGNGEPAGVLSGAAFAPSVLVRGSPRAPTTGVSLPSAPHRARGRRTFAAHRSFAPRPPPALPLL
jgi:hypothetical protein